jgi:chemotaxis protein MotB
MAQRLLVFVGGRESAKKGKPLMATVINHRLVGGIFLLGTALTGCVSQNRYDLLRAENEQLQQQLAAERGQITRLEGAIKYTIESDLLFPSGSWQMSDEGKQTLGNMASKLAPTQQNKLVVHGYTDNAPVGPELERHGVTSNEILSQKRAESVKNFLISEGVAPSMITAMGHGATNPVATNDTAEGRSKNRRVELTLGG